MSAPESPDVREDGPGVRRSNRKPLGFAVLALVLVVTGVVYTMNERSNDQIAAARREAQKPADPVSADALFTNAPEAGLIESRPNAMPGEAPAPALSMVRDGDATGIPNDGDHFAREWEQYRQQETAIRQAKMQAAMAALAAPTSLAAANTKAVQGESNSDGAPPPAEDALGGLRQGLSSLLASAKGAGGAGGGDADANNATGKISWLKTAAAPSDYLASGRIPAVSPYELKAGAVIPGVMIGGINSDLPGQIIGQVRENVYDSATGQHLLIPQGAKLIGTYDSQVTRGQKRVLVAWNRVVYPDGSSINIEAMPGSDAAGFSGFNDKVDNHYTRVFGDAILMSLFSAGVQLSQPQSNSVQGGYDSQQIVAGALGQQLGQTGMQLTQQNLRIQPTLQIRPGYRFVVMVTKDMIVEPWRAP